MSEIIENIKDASLRESLQSNYDNCAEMIRFAEAKNAAVIATSGAILSLTFDKLHFDSLTAGLFSAGYFFLVLALFIAFWALYPIYPVYHARRMTDELTMSVAEGIKLNLFVFSCIAQFDSPATFARALEKKYYPERALTPLEEDMAASIHVSAHIALRKFKYFKYGLTAFLMGCLLIVIFGPLK